MSNEPVALLHFNGAHRILVIVLLALFILSLALRLHGFSLPQWHAELGGPATEILAGQAREIRADDWAAALSTILSQYEHHPRFPVFNRDIGLGANMVVSPIKTPVCHYITLFRPHLWGYFFGRDFGLSWHWWSLLLGLFYSYFLCLFILSGGRFVIAAAGALLIAYSPFFQFKSLEYAEIAIFAALVFVSFVHLLFTDSSKQQIVHALILAWCLGGLFLNFYPPSQITLGYLLIFVTSGFLLQRRSNLLAQRHWSLRLVYLVGAVGLAAVAVVTFVIQGWAILRIISHTVFPGQRFVTGGDYPCWHVFANNFFLQFFIPENLPGTNISEYGSFLFFFPVLAVWAIYRMWIDCRINWLWMASILFCLFMVTFAVVGFPAWLSAVTFMSKVPPNRSMVALGVANAILLCAMTGSREREKLGKVALLIVTTGWGLFLLVMARSIVHNFPDLTLGELILPVLALTILGFALLYGRLAKIAICVLALISIGASCWFNPIVRGGSAFLYRNPLALKMLSMSARDQKARWVTFGSMFCADYPRLLGLPALNGTQSYPQFNLWSHFDPQRRFFEQYNRYAHVWFTVANHPATIDSPFLDQIKVSLPPTSPILNELGVRFFLVVSPEDQFFDSLPQFVKVLSQGRISLYLRRGDQLLGSVK